MGPEIDSDDSICKGRQIEMRGEVDEAEKTSQCQVSEPRPRFLIFLEAVDRLDGGRPCLACSFHCCPPCT